MFRARRATLVCAAAACWLIGAAAATADPLPITIGAEADVVSRYVWRGLPTSKDAAFQPHVSLGTGPWVFGAWGNINLGSDDPGGVSEVDLTATRSWSLLGWTADVGVIVYTFPSVEGSRSTAELALTGTVPLPGGVNAYGSIFHDFWRNGGATWLEAGLKGKREGVNKGTLTWRLAAGYGSKQYHEAYAGVSRSAPGALFADLAWQVGIGGTAYVRPHINASRLLDSRIREQFGAPDNLVVGVAVGTSL